VRDSRRVYSTSLQPLPQGLDFMVLVIFIVDLHGSKGFIMIICM